jgi:hypothetical protein
MSILSQCLYVYPVHAWWHRRLKESIRFPGIGLMGGCELTCGHWELNLSPLQAISPAPHIIFALYPSELQPQINPNIYFPNIQAQVSHHCCHMFQQTRVCTTPSGSPTLPEGLVPLHTLHTCHFSNVQTQQDAVQTPAIPNRIPLGPLVTTWSSYSEPSWPPSSLQWRTLLATLRSGSCVLLRQLLGTVSSTFYLPAFPLILKVLSQSLLLYSLLNLSSTTPTTDKLHCLSPILRPTTLVKVKAPREWPVGHFLTTGSLPLFWTHIHFPLSLLVQLGPNDWHLDKQTQRLLRWALYLPSLPPQQS